jgi:VanZ family protein
LKKSKILTKKIYKRTVYSAFIASTAAFIINSQMPAPPVDVPPIIHSDKLLHFFGFLVYFLITAKCYGILRDNENSSLIIPAAYCIIFGALDEYHQSFTGRSADVFDFIADTIGVFAGVLVFGYFRMILKKFEAKFVDDGK